MSLATDLLAQAKHLATKEPQRPKQASLRRALSAAYYALFHLLTSDAARSHSPRVLRSRVKRAFDHAAMKEVCIGIAAGSPSGKLAGLFAPPISQDLRDVARAFVELQQLRHQADYDLDYVPNRADVLQKVLLTEQAFTKWSAVKRSPNGLAFMAALLFHRIWRG